MCCFVVSRGAIEVLRPAGEALLDLRLRGRQRLGERGGERVLALRELAAVVLAELSLLLDQERHRIRACTGERALELLRARLGLPFDECVELASRLREMRVGLLRAR